MSTDADDVSNQVDSIDDPDGSKTYSYAYLSILFGAVVAGIVAAVAFGFVTPDVTITAQVSVGWILEYAAAAFVGVFILFTFAQVANIVGIGFIAGVIRVIARIADNYELPNQNDSDDN